MATVSINGNTFTFSGGDLSIVGGRVVLDGVVQEGEKLAGVVKVHILDGAIQHVHSDASIECGDVGGSVRAKMSVTCRSVQGDVTAGMSVTCGDIRGDVDAGMSVICKSRK